MRRLIGFREFRARIKFKISQTQVFIDGMLDSREYISFTMQQGSEGDVCTYVTRSLVSLSLHRVSMSFRNSFVKVLIMLLDILYLKLRFSVCPSLIVKLQKKFIKYLIAQ